MHIGLDDVVKRSFERLQKGAIEKPEEKLDAATAVSYTHLDVYKRQEVFGTGIDMWVRSQGDYIKDYKTIRSDRI